VLQLALARGHEVLGLYYPQIDFPPQTAFRERLFGVNGSLADAPWPEIRSFAPDLCIHTAWITTPGEYPESPENLHFLDWSRNFIQNAAHIGIQRFMVLGTCIEYQITSEPLSEETTPVKPVSLYARCKDDLRRELEKMSSAWNIELCWSRIFYPYGPREHPQRLCSTLLKQLRQNRVVELKTPHSRKDYVFIEDVASALLFLAEKKAAGIYNIGTGVGISVFEMAQALGNLLGKPGLVQLSKNTQEDAYPFVVADMSKLRSLGWEPSFTIQAGLARMI
jgi:nucleoside-diphosphate-sugar epimerase